MKKVMEVFKLKNEGGWSGWEPSIMMRDLNPLLTAEKNEAECVLLIENEFVSIAVFKNRKYFAYIMLNTPYETYNRIQRIENKVMVEYIESIRGKADFEIDETEWSKFKRSIMFDELK